MINRFAIPAVGALLFSGVLLFRLRLLPRSRRCRCVRPAHYAPLEKYEAMKIPADNAMTQDKATLGWQLCSTSACPATESWRAIRATSTRRD